MFLLYIYFLANFNVLQRERHELGSLAVSNGVHSSRKEFATVGVNFSRADPYLEWGWRRGWATREENSKIILILLIRSILNCGSD